MNSDTKKTLLEILKLAIWEKDFSDDISISEDVFVEFQKHAIVALPTQLLNGLIMSPELKDKWKRSILQQISYYCKYIHAQRVIPLQIPYVVLKGTSASMYYTHPEYRSMGDIDIITKREDYIEACKALQQEGYIEITSEIEHKNGRHRSFRKNGIYIEIHQFFSLSNDIEKAKWLDDIVVENINPTHVLPDTINGLTLLEHISQHLENGLGLRHIIDWMMFVDKCLQDNKWPAFQNLVKKTGLETLAIIITRMCEMYLGLIEHKWCRNADVQLCKQLMEYILNCGNFGNKKTSDSDIGENVFVLARNHKTTFKLLQERGLVNWKAARKIGILRPFAWLYQTGRYIVKGIGRKGAIAKIKEEYRTAKKRNEMFETLGVRRASKGSTIYINGKYLKQ